MELVHLTLHDDLSVKQGIHIIRQLVIRDYLLYMTIWFLVYTCICFFCLLRFWMFR